MPVFEVALVSFANKIERSHMNFCPPVSLIGRVVLIMLLIPWGQAVADSDPCSRLLGSPDLLELPDAPTTLTSARTVEAVDGLPAHCLVEGYVAPQVHFELRLPGAGEADVRAWNGKFLMQGCGGLCGGINSATCDDALVRNYAVVVTDMGHRAPSYQSLWAYDNREAEIDFAYRATHVVTVAAKAIVEHYYGSAPDHSYFRGCSTGGRQGLVEAQRFPADYDGVIAGAPVLNETATAALHLIWSGQANLDGENSPVLSADRVGEIHARIIGACDGLDGYEDGLIDDPRRCDWEQILTVCKTGRAEDGCVTGGEIEVLRKLYRGPSNSAGERLLPGGLMPGSEYEWVPNFVGRNGPAIFHPDGPIKQLYQTLLFYDDPGPGHTAREFDFDRDPPRLAMMETIYSALNPDLRAFRARGGKLIIYQGWDDIEVTPLNTIDYFELMEAAMGGAAGTRSFARLFMLPGVAHCRRGPGADTVDWLTALEKWVEDDAAPDALIAHHQIEPQNYRGLPRPRFPLAASVYDWSRPVFPYPGVARFRGRGDPASPANWKAHDPSK
jgi:hypothetical protein